MRINLLLLYLILSLNIFGQKNLSLVVSPNIDQEDIINKDILIALDSFLLKKDTSTYPEIFNHWKENDFKTFRTPYHFLRGAERNGAGEIAYRPSVMEILPIHNSQYIVKFAYISTSTESSFIKMIYNLIAEHKDDKVLFSSYINHIGREWNSVIDKEAKYIVSPNRNADYLDDIKKQRKFNDFISEYLEVENIPYTFYSAGNVEEFFNLQGIQYHPMMYADSTGGIVFNNVVLSANNSEFYPHEISHLYIKSRLPSIDIYFDEGLATLLGGSGKMTYLEYVDGLKNNIDQFDFSAVFQNEIYDRSLWQEDMPISYVLAAVICDYGITKMGRDKFFNLVNSDKDKFTVVKELGLAKSDFNTTIKEFILNK